MCFCYPLDYVSESPNEIFWSFGKTFHEKYLVEKWTSVIPITKVLANQKWIHHQVHKRSYFLSFLKAWHHIISFHEILSSSIRKFVHFPTLRLVITEWTIVSSRILHNHSSRVGQTRTQFTLNLPSWRSLDWIRSRLNHPSLSNMNRLHFHSQGVCSSVSEDPG